MLRFDWDEKKIGAIGRSMECGLKRLRVFRDPNARLFHDPEHSEEEDRFILIGVSATTRPLVVVHCYRESDSVIRIISARKATKKEVRFYEEGI
jgi:uncharacterized DUF497 family protein